MYKEAVLSIPDDLPCQHWNVVTGVGQLVTPLGGTKCVSRCRDCVVCVAVSQDGRDTTSHGIDKMCVVCVADTVSCVVRHSVVCRETVVVCRARAQGPSARCAAGACFAVESSVGATVSVGFFCSSLSNLSKL